MSRTFHVALSVRGALRADDKNLRGAFKHDDGRPMKPSEVRDALLDELAKGNEFLPYGACDNFDPKSGCRGHPAAAVTSEERSDGD